MTIRVQSIHFDADAKLLSFIREKVDKMITFYDQILGGEVFLKLEKSDDAKNKVVQIKLHMPGSDIVVSEQCRTFEEATDLCMNSLSRKVKQHKEKVRGI